MMKKSIVAATVAVITLGVSVAGFAKTTTPYLYVYATVGNSPGGLIKAQMTDYKKGKGEVGLRSAAPITIDVDQGNPVAIVQNGAKGGRVSASLTFHLNVPVNG